MTAPQLPATSATQSTGSDLRDLLDSEIEHARAERSQHGWTTWGLVVALGAMLWAAVGEWERSRVSLHHATVWFLVASLVIDQFFAGVLFDAQIQHDRKRVRLGSFWGRRPEALLAIAVRGAALIGGAIVAREQLIAVAVVAVSAVYLLLITFVAVMLVMMWHDFPMQTGYTKASPILRWGSVTLTWTALVASALSIAPGGTVPELRVGILAGVSLFLATLLIVERYREPLMESLVDLRRDLSLGEIDLASAQQRCRIILRGMAFSDWAQRDVRSLVDLHEKVTAANRVIDDLAGQCNADIAQLKTGPANPSQIARAIRDRLITMERLVPQVGADRARMGDASAEIAGKKGYMTGMYDFAPVEASSIEAVTDPLVQDAIRIDVRLQTQWPKYRDTVAAELATLGL